MPLPDAVLETRTDADGRLVVRDPVRRRWVRLTPEEGVRQRLLLHLLSLGYPPGLLAVEKAFTYVGRTWRADVVAYDRARRPLLLAECKAPGVPLTQAVLDQLARYNATVRARVLAATNGAALAVGVAEGGVIRGLPDVPFFTSLSGAPPAP
ncbi:MAG TPA: type I restriction enzyme HsdR N-terminal domain-containing protein [Rhodothermales bacterium]|nr:type I restriction enzyme HsdR N-terminal domain-containing protein [Rhodothermales bacterium]